MADDLAFLSHLSQIPQLPVRARPERDYLLARTAFDPFLEFFILAKANLPNYGFPGKVGELEKALVLLEPDIRLPLLAGAPLITWDLEWRALLGFLLSLGVLGENPDLSEGLDLAALRAQVLAWGLVKALSPEGHRRAVADSGTQGLARAWAETSRASLALVASLTAGRLRIPRVFATPPGSDFRLGVLEQRWDFFLTAGPAELPPAAAEWDRTFRLAEARFLEMNLAANDFVREIRRPDLQDSQAR